MEKLHYIMVNKYSILLMVDELMFFHLQHLQVVKRILLNFGSRKVLMLISKLLPDRLHYIQVNKYLILLIVDELSFFSFTASAGGYKDLVEYLLSKGAKVDLKNNDGDTPLHWGK
jgi:ankyrin repeat protein